MIPMPRFLCALAALTMSQFGLPQTLRPSLDSLAIVGAKIVTEPGKVIEVGTVLVQNGMITKVAESVDCPPGTEIIDGKGLVVYAGFVDMGVTKGLRAVEGGTRKAEPFDPTVDVATQMPLSPPDVHPGLSAVDLFDPDDAAWKAERTAGFTSAVVYPRAGVLKGTVAVVNLDGSARNTSTVADRVAWAIGLDGTGGNYPGTTFAAFALVRQACLDADWQADMERHYAVSGGPRPVFDPNLVELRKLRSEKIPVIIEADQVWKIDRSMNLSRELGLDPILLGCNEGYKCATLLKSAKVVVKLNFGPDPEANKGKSESEPGEKTADEPEAVKNERKRLWLCQVKNAQVLQETGALIAFTTAGAKDEATFFENLRAAVKEGLTADSALAALTTNPAQMLGFSKRCGKVQVGMAATLTVMTSDFTNPKAKVKFLVVDGKKIDPLREPFKFDNSPQDFGKEGGQ